MNMLFYTACTNWFIVITTWPLFASVLDHDTINYGLSYYIITSYLLAGTLALVIGGFFVFHLWLIGKQYTTIEFCEKRSENDSNFKTSPYNRGPIQNMRNVFGNNILIWLVPFCK
jgi:palmitoyltransferase ZDHHC2/15/20